MVRKKSQQRRCFYSGKHGLTAHPCVGPSRRFHRAISHFPKLLVPAVLRRSLPIRYLFTAGGYCWGGNRRCDRLLVWVLDRQDSVALQEDRRVGGGGQSICTQTWRSVVGIVKLRE